MPRGGFRPGAGRPRKVVQAGGTAVVPGESPLDYLLRIMRDTTIDDRRRDWAAAAAAPYMHAKRGAPGASGVPPRERERIAKLVEERAASDAWELTADVIRAKFGGDK